MKLQFSVTQMRFALRISQLEGHQSSALQDWNTESLAPAHLVVCRDLEINKRNIRILKLFKLFSVPSFIL
jgi:hypothetical protein